MNVRNNYRKAWAAITVSLSCLLIYVLACVMSPTSWSPDSSKIAILVTPPGNEPNMYAIFAYDIKTGEHKLLDEAQGNSSLSAPAWSPDGKWIAYYRAEQANQSDNNDINEQDRTQKNEEDKMLPSFLFDLIENCAKDEKKSNFIDLQLMLIRPDGGERKTLQTMKFQNDNNDKNNSVALLQPVWSRDSKRIFYMRGYEDFWYAGNIDIPTGKTYLNLLTSGDIAVSPDNKWIASFIKENNILIVANLDGSLCKYFKLNFEVKNENLIMVDGMSWSPDSKKIFITDKEFSLYAIDTTSGQTDLLIASDPNNSYAYYTISSTGQEIYYITNPGSEIGNTNNKKIELWYLNLRNSTKGKLFTFELPDINEEPARFSIAPNGKLVLLRSIIKDANNVEKTALIFFDGRTQKIVETDSWLQ